MTMAAAFAACIADRACGLRPKPSLKVSTLISSRKPNSNRTSEARLAPNIPVGLFCRSAPERALVRQPSPSAGRYTGVANVMAS